MPHDVRSALLRTFDGFEIATGGKLKGGQGLIDHIAHTKDLTLGNVGVWPKKSADGTRLSDHCGVCGDLGLV